MSLSLTFWGTRGSIPTPGSATVRYGGNTPCVELRRGDGSFLILDAGTGIRELGQALVERAGGAPIIADVLVSHAHWDHIQGLPYFAPIFLAGSAVTLWSPPALTPQLDRAVREQMSPGVFPVVFGNTAGAFRIRALDGTFDGRGNRFVVRTMPVRHPGGSTAYRIIDADTPERILVYISDNELGDGRGYDVPRDWRDTLVAFTKGAAVLVHDAMYTTEEYQQHRGWGHSDDLDALELAIDAEVGRLVLFHHNPERSDAELDARVAALRSEVAQRGAAVDVLGAAEGLTLSV